MPEMRTAVRISYLSTVFKVNEKGEIKGKLSLGLPKVKKQLKSKLTL